MSLRCLLFSSNAETVKPLWQVLADLGIEGEYCHSAVDAVEKVTTQAFQIVITDWEDQPEAAFLLKTARDLKASQRPLTLAIVSDDARLPEALQAGANSILLKPIHADQARDTMSTACELLRSKLPSTTPWPAGEPSGTAAMAAAAAAGSVPLPSPVIKSPGKMQVEELPPSPGSAPGAQADEESEVVETRPNIAAVTQQEPAASTLGTSSAQQPDPESLTGWAMLQARLTKMAPPAPAKARAENKLLSYGDPGYGTPRDGLSAQKDVAGDGKSRREAEPEAALFAYMSGKPSHPLHPLVKARPNWGKVFTVGALAVVCLWLGVAPRTRRALQSIYRTAVGKGSRLLNPPPAPLPQAVVLHDSFGQSGDEYKLPVVGNIPDATTDPSQIRVLPVIDPTVKPQKSPDASTSQDQAPSVDGTSQEANQAVPNLGVQEPIREGDANDAMPTNSGDAPRNSPEAVPTVVPTQPRPIVGAPPGPSLRPQLPVAPAKSHSVATPAVSANVGQGIPSSLKSQVASTVPQNSGNKPVEAAMSSIEPINLPELVVRELLIQPVNPEYPPSAKASGQRGSVVLQVLIGHDGTVQDAKFLQGSLVFARAAIDAVKQWRFKPYAFNGRPVSVQSVITLTFKPPA
jgi:TonB family protein